MANEGSYPENARGLAMNGAEIVYRASYPHPHTGNEFFEIQSRARALDNNFYVVAPNLATYYLDESSRDSRSTRSAAARSSSTTRAESSASTCMAPARPMWPARSTSTPSAAFRTHAQWDNWMKDVRTELYQLIYEQPIYPKNLYMDRPPFNHAEFQQEVIDKQIDMLVERDIWRRPT